MSAIAGIFYLDGRSVEKENLEQIINSEAIRKRGPDDRGVWCEGPIGFAQGAFWTTPEQHLEKQPLVDKHTGLVLVMDGRVDNRSELLTQLRSLGVRAPLETDADIVLYAYDVWKEKCPEKIIGDFAFAIWDSRRNELFCVRDALGVRPFFYYKSATFLAFASEPLALFAYSEIHKRPDLDTMTAYLLNDFENSEQTEFKNVLRLKPAHWMRVKNGSLQINQYWDVDPNHFLNLKSFEDYAEAFLQVFRTAITSQSRSSAPLGMMLSGGFDSSSILSVIEDLKRQGKLAVDLSAYSVAFDSPPSDESRYIRSVQERWGTPIHWNHPVPPHPLWAVPEASNLGQALWNTMSPFLVQPPLNSLVNDGKRVLLTGVGGDEFMDVSLFFASDLLKAGHPIRAFKLFHSYTNFQVTTLHDTLPLLLGPLRQMLSRFLPASLKKFYRLFHPVETIKTYNWICQPYLDQVFERKKQRPWYLRNHQFNSISHEESYSAVHSGSRISGLELLDRLAASAGTVEFRHPFCDRRLVELAYSIPIEVLGYGWKPKGFLRRVMHPYLPEPIQKRKDKGDFTVLVNKLLIYDNREAARELLSTSYLDQIGLIDKKKAWMAYEAYCQKYAKNLDVALGSNFMWQLLSLEFWARKTFSKIETNQGGYREERKAAVQKSAKTV